MKKIAVWVFLPLFILSLLSCSSKEDKLFDAVKKGDLAKVKELVEDGASVIAKDRNGLTPLEVARLNNKVTIINYLYGKTKLVFDKETEKLLRSEFKPQMTQIKSLEKSRKAVYAKYLAITDSLLNMMNYDKRVSDDLMKKQEKYFEEHQKEMRVFINAKVDLIEDIMRVFVKKDYVNDIDSKDARHIVNVNIMAVLKDI